MNVQAQPRVCRDCGRLLPLKEFRRRYKDREGREGNCRECHREAMRRWRQERRIRGLLDFAQAAKWRADRRYLDRALGELIRSFGGAEEFARQYHQLFLRYAEDVGKARPAVDLLLAVPRMADIASRET